MMYASELNDAQQHVRFLLKKHRIAEHPLALRAIEQGQIDIHAAALLADWREVMRQSTDAQAVAVRLHVAILDDLVHRRAIEDRGQRLRVEALRGWLHTYRALLRGARTPETLQSLATTALRIEDCGYHPLAEGGDDE